MALLFPSTTLYYHAYTTHFPKELCTKHHCTTYSANCNTKLAQNNLKLLYTEAFTDRKLWPKASFDTEKLSHTQWQQKLQRLTTSLSHHSPKSPLPSVTTSLSHPFYVIISCSGFLPKTHPTQHSYKTATMRSVLQRHVTNPHVSTHVARKHGNIMRPFHCDLQPQMPKHSKTTHTHTSTQRKLYTKNTFTHSKFLCREAFTHSKLLHTESFYTEKLLHRGVGLLRIQMFEPSLKIDLRTKHVIIVSEKD